MRAAPPSLTIRCAGVIVALGVIRLAGTSTPVVGATLQTQRPPAASTESGRCASPAPFDVSKGPHWNGWGAGLANTRFQPASEAGLTADQVPRLTLTWAFGFPTARSAYAQDECCTFRGSLVALNAETGALVWKTYTIDREAKPIGKNSAGVTRFGPSGAGIWSSPTIDAKRRVIYASTGKGSALGNPSA